VLAVMALSQAGIGVVLVAVPAFAEEQGTPAAAGALVAVWSVGSLAGGLLYGARRWDSPLRRRYVALLALLALSFAPLALATSPVTFGFALAVSGLALAPWLACSDALTQRLAPAGATTEAFTWLVSGASLGHALGGPLAGVAIDRRGVGTALLAAVGLTAVAAVVAIARWASLGAPVAPVAVLADERR
jgi:MFS family permease